MAQGEAPELDRELLGQLFPVFRRAGLQGLFGGGRGGGAPTVESGDYLVSLKVGDRTMRQVLRVEKTQSAPGAMAREESEDEEREP